MPGVVVHFDAHRGFGFVLDHFDTKLYFTHEDLNDKTDLPLHTGQRVTFLVQSAYGHLRPRARRIAVIGDGA